MRPFPAGPKHSGAKVGQPLFRKTSRRTTRNVNRFRHPFKVSKKGLVIFTNEEKEESSVCLKRELYERSRFQFTEQKKRKGQLVSPSRPVCVMATPRKEHRHTLSPPRPTGHSASLPCDSLTCLRVGDVTGDVTDSQPLRRLGQRLQRM